MMRYWMVITIKYFVLAFILLTVETKAGQTNIVEYKPIWSVGQKWRVDVEKMTEPPAVPKKRLEKWKPTKYTITYQLEMEGVIEIDGEKCSQIRINCVAVNGAGIKHNPKLDIVEFHRIFLRQFDNTLSKVERLQMQSGNVEIVAASRSFPAESVDATDWVGVLPLSFPTFGQEQSKQKPVVRASKDGKVVFESSDRCRQTEEIMRIHADGKETDALRVTLEKDRDDGPSRRTTQTWIKGMPWWTEAAHARDGHQWCTARLLKD